MIMEARLKAGWITEADLHPPEPAEEPAAAEAAAASLGRSAFAAQGRDDGAHLHRDARTEAAGRD